MTDEHLISLQPGTVIGGKYEVVKCLGSGSMGLVYACRNRDLMGQMVAVKVLFPEVAADKVAAARFKNEVLASYEVSHPNVVRAYELIRDGDLVAYSMEFVGGGDLAERLSGSERIVISETVRLMAQMAAGLQAIHDAGIVHRDMKPENILLTKEGNVKIADFGIARNRHGPKLTEHGGVVGTVEYVAPEYMLKSQVDWRSDIYALGILAYEMVTGEAPFKGESVYATMTKRLKTDPDAPSKLRPECPVELDRVILRAMHRDPDQRYQSGMEVYEDLQKIATQYGYKMTVSSGGAGKPVVSSSGERFIEDDAAQEDFGSTPVPASPSATNVGSEALRASVGPVVMAGTTRPVVAASAGVGMKSPSSSSKEQKSDFPDSRGAGTEILSSGFVDFALENDVPSGFAAPPVVGPPALAPEDLVSDEWESGVDSHEPGSVSRKFRSVSPRYAEQESERLAFGDIAALGIAAVVGIVCGLAFLKMVAPSLLVVIGF